MGVLAALVAVLPGPARAQAPVRLAAQAAPVPARLQARVAEAVAKTWGVDTTGLVLSWGVGSLAHVPDTSSFRLLGNGDGGWFAVMVTPPGQPVAAIRLRAGLVRERLVAARALRSGLKLVAGDIRREQHLRWGPPETPDDVDVQEGWVVRRPLSAGEELLRPRVAPPPVVLAGQPVRLLWQEGNVAVAIEGTALNDAALGAAVRIRTTRRRGTVQATATAPGEARMMR